MVNPGSSAEQMSFASPVQLVHPVGGGALDANAETGGWGLQTAQVSSVVVPAHGGVVWLDG